MNHTIACCVLIILSSSIINGTTPTELDGLSFKKLRGLGGPGPIFSFGHNIQRQGALFLRNSVAYFNNDAPATSRWILSYSAVYGVTNRFTALASAPVVVKDDIVLPGFRTKGLGSVLLQGEYALYDHYDVDSRHQFTIVGALRMPSSSVDIPTLAATPSLGYFLGFTTFNLAEDWYTYSAFGCAWFNRKKPISMGKHILWSLGVGRTITNTDRTYFALLLDMSCLYSRPDFINGIPALFTGQTYVGLGPTFRFSYKRLFILGGLQYPIGQVVRNFNELIKYRAAFSISYLFY